MLTEARTSWDEVRRALKLMLEETGEFHINKEVYEHAMHVAAAIQSFPPPRLWNHGPDSVVFDWGFFMLTISRTMIGGQLSASFTGQ